VTDIILRVILTDSHLKIERANKHIADIEGRIVLLHTTDTARIDIHPERGGEILTHNFSDSTAFDDIALMLGDAIHNLNCALDYTWLQTIEKLAPSLVDDRAKFPVRKTIDEVKGSLTKAEVHTICPKLYGFMVNTIKPCHGGDSAIWPIHTLDIRDKHRLLIPVLSTGRIDGIRIIDEDGQVWPGIGSTEQLQRPPYVIWYQKGLHVKDKGKLTAQIVIENGDSGYPLLIPDTLVHYSHFILRVVESFERFLETERSG